MGIRSTREKGRRRRATYRVGGDFRLGGMYLEGDPGSIPPNRFRHLVNVRWLGGALTARGGQERFNTTALQDTDACVTSIEDFQAAPYRLYVIVDGCPGISSSVGFSSVFFDHDAEPEGQRGQYKDSATDSFVLAPFDGSLYQGVDDDLGKFVLIRAGWDEGIFDVAGGTQEIPLATFTGFIIRCMAEFDGKLFIGLDGGAGASKIVTWDGLTIRDDLTSIDPPTAFGIWRDKLVAGFASGTNHIRYRAVGDSPGTWTTVAPGAGTVASVYIKSYKDILYITDGAENVWSYDGTTLQVARNVVGATIRALETFNGFLYYGYLSSLSTGIIGQYDGSSWTDAHKNLTTQVSTIRQPRCLKEYRGALWVGVLQSVGSPSAVYRSPQLTTSGTWTLESGVFTSPGDINDMVTF